MAQKKYQPTWESIDSRPMPTWYNDAKFGIFIHWGPYSVPAFSKVGSYSEWYWNQLAKRDKEGDKNETKEFHQRVYGEDFAYPDFIPMFKCELFDPNQWANTFKESGAKYVVLTSKHHDGYCLWPSAESNKSWGRPWNSTNTGPMRDLLGELTNSVRKENLKMGIYYSLYEWYNPLYNANVDMYVDQHMTPQFKDVVERYSPSVIFTDGEWDHPHTTWKATETLAWLYNESANKEEVVINDRWGKNTRHNHGGYYTTEYGSGLPNDDNAWEENRGMAHSFGYSRTENIEDYNSTQQLLYMLIDIVSRGGNFLLDIGPTADGRIPVIMQERLIEMGDWLKVNGEAIYGTRIWNTTCQWSEGTVKEAKRAQYKSKYDVMKFTVNPDDGMAIKEIFFTQKGKSLYCICPVFPEGKLFVKDVHLIDGATVTMLGVDEKLNWEKSGNNIEIEMPKINPSQMPCEFAWTFKIDGIQK
ncbi:MAG: alpha-L-fucosidase [Bacteroidetes bacterium]|nr:alpha-L-fucosidase [Bacteroidota bacterium]